MIPNLNMLHIVCFVLLFDLFPRTRAEVFTAIAEMEHLLETHKKIIDDLDYYIDKEEQRLKTLKGHLGLYKREHDKAMEDIPNYLGNPINAFTLIKRLTTDLDFIEESIKIGTEFIKNVTINHEGAKYPVLEDLTGAAQALTRLKETYHLNVTDLSEGKLNGVVYSTPMTASDCYELGRALYNEKDYTNAVAWMVEARRKIKTEDGPHSFTEVNTLEYIAFGHYLSLDTRAALEWTEKLLVLDPTHTRARGNVPHYQKLIAADEVKMQKQRRGDTGDERQLEVQPELTGYAKSRKSYEALCRGTVTIPSKVSKRLTCRYMTENHPFLKLAPIKMEMMYLDPDVVLFHDVLSDNEIQQIKQMALPKFKRAVVNDPKTGGMIPAKYRISKSAWLHDTESPIVARISQRVADMTGLSMDSAEDLQVGNYGIGGHYEPHYDFARKEEHVFTNGNRIATVLFYMSDVAQGGATVFTELGLSVFPVARAAAFWLNLHPSGEGDFDTRHAACPVLQGSKWVSNKWIHQNGQEFLKPCNLEFQEEGMVRHIHRPVPKTSR